jgi:hypothetical protein
VPFCKLKSNTFPSIDRQPKQVTADVAGADAARGRAEAAAACGPLTGSPERSVPPRMPFKRRRRRIGTEKALKSSVRSSAPCTEIIFKVLGKDPKKKPDPS